MHKQKQEEKEAVIDDQEEEEQQGLVTGSQARDKEPIAKREHQTEGEENKHKMPSHYSNQPDRLLFWTIDVPSLGRTRAFLLLSILTFMIYGAYSYIQEFFFKVNI